MKHTKQSIISKDGVSYLIPFILITSCFALWGFANDITNPMVKAFSKIFRMSATDGALVQVAFYGGYFAMAFPAAMFIRKFSYKAGVLLGLGLLCFRSLLILSRQDDRRVLPVSDRLLYSDLRTLLSGNQLQPLYTFYGNGRDSYKTSEPRPVFQSNGIAARNVRGDAIYSG